ncbi:MAG TPA: hypothetical protein VM165_17535, partial [Planctomycetaceae bacterium]|nr:hypothetical protein [Planctomycetaceae bacterium]
MQHKSRIRRLTVESLEDRSLMAGNLTVSVVDGSLVISGDDEANGFVIEQAGQNAFRIRTNSLGGENTLMNGSADTDQTFFGVTDDINIALKGGPDQVGVGVKFSSPLQIPRNLNVDGGSAADSVLINAAVGASGRGGYAILRSAKLQVDHAAVPKDFVAKVIDQLDAYKTMSVGGNVFISGTETDDTYVLDGIKANNLSVETFAGRDQVRVSQQPLLRGDVDIDLGDGD